MATQATSDHRLTARPSRRILLPPAILRLPKQQGRGTIATALRAFDASPTRVHRLGWGPVVSPEVRGVESRRALSERRATLAPDMTARRGLCSPAVCCAACASAVARRSCWLRLRVAVERPRSHRSPTAEEGPTARPDKMPKARGALCVPTPHLRRARRVRMRACLASTAAETSSCAPVERGVVPSGLRSIAKPGPILRAVRPRSRQSRMVARARGRRRARARIRRVSATAPARPTRSRTRV